MYPDNEAGDFLKQLVQLDNLLIELVQFDDWRDWLDEPIRNAAFDVRAHVSFVSKHLLPLAFSKERLNEYMCDAEKSRMFYEKYDFFARMLTGTEILVGQGRARRSPVTNHSEARVLN